MSPKVHQFTATGWFLIVSTFLLGYGIARFDYQIQTLINVVTVFLGGDSSWKS